jgi:hypothetical protein
MRIFTKARVVLERNIDHSMRRLALGPASAAGGGGLNALGNTRA